MSTRTGNDNERNPREGEQRPARATPRKPSQDREPKSPPPARTFEGDRNGDPRRDTGSAPPLGGRDGSNRELPAPPPPQSSDFGTQEGGPERSHH